MVLPLNGRPSCTRRSVSPAFTVFDHTLSEKQCCAEPRSEKSERETTFNGGSLGSRIDEERSQLR